MSQPYEIGFKLEAHKSQNTFILGKEIKGEMQLRAKEEIEVEYITVNLFREAKGLMQSQSASLYHKRYNNPKLLKTGQIYSFPISFIPEKHESYKGKNVELSFRFEGELKLDGQNTGEKIVSFFRKLGSSAKKKNSLQIYLQPETEAYQLAKQEIKLDSDSSFQSFLALPVLILFLVFISNELIDLVISIPIGILLSLFCIAYFLIGRYAVGNPRAELFQEENEGFHIKMYKEPSWHFLKGIEMSYEIAEEVVDRRGTSSSTQKEVIYDSLIQKSKLSQEVLDFYFNFPIDKPTSMSWEDVSIIWQLKLKVFTSLGLNFKVYGPFILSRPLLPKTETQA